MLNNYTYKDNQFETQEKLFDFLRQNKNIFKIEKKSSLKKADAIVANLFQITDNVIKAIETNTLLEKDVLQVALAINTTNIMDSHDDVHISNLWNKSLKEQKFLNLLQEHQMTFEKIISDNVKALVQMMTWKTLGYDFTGNTQVLVFNTSIEKSRNEFMFNQYAKGYVRNHSVGMRYISLALAMNSNSPYDVEEKKIWDKYYPEIVNSELPMQKGFFWAVTEAQLIEGSAVVLGSNYATPVISVKENRQLSSNIEDTTNEAVKTDTSKDSHQQTESENDQRKKDYLLKIYTKK